MKRPSILNVVIAAFALSSVFIYIRLTVGSLGPTSFDDAYMFIRYAKHWLTGEGFCWNPVDGPAYGVTSPAYLIAITAALGLTQYADGTVLTLSSYVAGILSILALVLLGFVVRAGNRSRICWTPLLVAPAVLLVHPFDYHSITGMETTLSLFANAILACSIVLATRQHTSAALLLCLFSGLFSFSTRPDNGLYALLLPPLFFLANDRRSWKYALVYASLMTLFILCSMTVGRFVFGDFLPLPFFAKSAGFYQGYVGAFRWNAMKEMLVFWTAAIPFLLVIVSTISKRSLAPLSAIAFVVVATFAYYASVTQIMGLAARYYYPSLAFVVLAAFTSAFPRPEERIASRTTEASGLRFVLALAVLLPALSDEIRHRSTHLWQAYMIAKPVAIRGRMTYETPAGQRLPDLGWWTSILAMCDLLEDVPRGTVLAASECGLVGSRFPGLTIVDLVGLHDRTIARRGFDVGYVLSREPDIIWFPHSDYTGPVAQLLDHPTFQRDFEYYPEVYDYGIALRRTSQWHDRIKEALTGHFQRVYGNLDMADQVAEPVAPPDKE